MPSQRRPRPVPPRRTPPAPARRAPASSPSPAGTTWLWLSPPPRARHDAGWVLLPLRLFLGVTFCFAGLQKLANPAFFRASNPGSIQAQLAGAARRSPIHGLVSPLVHVAVPLGILIALTELAIGIGTLLGLWARIAAIGGAVLSFFLFLTVSFHSSPYYTGADIVFLFAWIPLVIAGAGGAWSLDAVAAAMVRHREGAEPNTVVPVPFSAVRRVCGHYEDGTCAARRHQPCEPAPCPWLSEHQPKARRLGEQELDRRTFAATGAMAGVAAVGALLSAGVAAAIGRLVGGSAPASNTQSLSPGAAPTTTGPASTTSTSGPGATTTSTAVNRPSGTRIGPASDVPVGGAASFQDPRSGDPSLVVQPQQGTFLAFDAVCPHAGCTVEYVSSQRLFICPCHGSEFNGRTGAVEVGPAASGLAPIRIAEGSDGQLYVD